MKNTLVLLVVSFVSCFVGCSKKFTEEEAREKFENERIFAVEKENADLRSQLVASQAAMLTAEKEVFELQLKTAGYEASITIKDEAIEKAEKEKAGLTKMANDLAELKGVLTNREKAVKEAEKRREKWDKDVADVKLALAGFASGIEKSLVELQIMEVNFRQAQETFAMMKMAPNTPANRQRMSDHVALISKMQRELYIAQQDARNKLVGDLTRAKLMIP